MVEQLNLGMDKLVLAILNEDEPAEVPEDMIIKEMKGQSRILSQTIFDSQTAFIIMSFQVLEIIEDRTDPDG